MIFHELNILVSPNLSDADIASFIEKTEVELQKLGKVISSRKPERRRLAYPLQNHVEAWLYSSDLNIEAGDKKQALDSIEKMLKEDKNVLRFLIVKKDSKKAEVKPRRGGHRPTVTEEKTEEPVLEEKPKKQKVQLEEIDEQLDKMLQE
ncbi:MAG: 30S ribosomal protein S6 [Candidatus Pacebacteria bacterium]|nr:30S ribosomal protein S6 [Candidatus Paceibacterota bacterium]